MSAAAGRARLAAVGCDIVAADGAPADRRAAALRRSLDGAAVAAITLQDLDAVPAWLRLPRPAQRRIARLAALASLSSALARSIDGRWLGELATAAGEDAVEWALDAAPTEADARALPVIGSAELEARGFTLLRETLAAPLRPLLDWAPREAAIHPADRAVACVSAAIRRAA